MDDSGDGFTVRQSLLSPFPQLAARAPGEGDDPFDEAMWTLWFLACDGRPRLALDTAALAWATTGETFDLWSLYDDNGRDLPTTTTALLAKADRA